MPDFPFTGNRVNQVPLVLRSIYATLKAVVRPSLRRPTLRLISGVIPGRNLTSAHGWDVKNASQGQMNYRDTPGLIQVNNKTKSAINKYIVWLLSTTKIGSVWIWNLIINSSSQNTVKVNHKADEDFYPLPLKKHSPPCN